MQNSMTNIIIRRVRVNRTHTGAQALDATGRTQYVDAAVVAAMPNGTGDEVEVIFFKLDLSKRNGVISDDDLENEFDQRNLKPVDPFTLAAANEDDPAFADSHPNATHWKDIYDNWCYGTFNRWDDERCVGVYRGVVGWSGHWWFAGVRK